MKIHQIKIDFQVTEQIKRYVFVYLVEAKFCYLIDSGVYGSEKQIGDYMRSIGRDISEIKGIFLTHAHPDHIGTVAWFKEYVGSRIYASAGERRWIEDIDLQYRERPIPNFYKLAGNSANVDMEVKNGDTICLKENLEINVIATPEHSVDEISYRLGDCLFVGDAIPVKDNIPIYINKRDTLKTLQKIRDIKGVRFYYPAWDSIYLDSSINGKLDDALAIVKVLDKQVQTVRRTTLDRDIAVITDKVCENMKMPYLKENPLFMRTIAAHILENESY